MDDLPSNWAYTVMASLAWSLKAWTALLVSESPRHEAKHRAEKRALLRMEFWTFCAAVNQIPSQVVRGGRRLVYRLLCWNPWHPRTLDRYRPGFVASVSRESLLLARVTSTVDGALGEASAVAPRYCPVLHFEISAWAVTQPITTTVPHDFSLNSKVPFHTAP